MLNLNDVSFSCHTVFSVIRTTWNKTEISLPPPVARPKRMNLGSHYDVMGREEKDETF